MKAESETKRLSALSQGPWQVSSTARAEPLPMLLLTDTPGTSQPLWGASLKVAVQPWSQRLCPVPPGPSGGPRREAAAQPWASVHEEGCRGQARGGDGMCALQAHPQIPLGTRSGFLSEKPEQGLS